MIDKDRGLLLNQTRFSRRFEVIELNEPELFIEIFPYTQVPRITFDGGEPVVKPARELLVTDTTFRDGQQARPPTPWPKSSRSFNCWPGWAAPTA